VELTTTPILAPPCRPDAHRAGVALLAMMLPVPAAAQVESGRTLFQTHCARCHDGAAKLKTEPARLAALLRSGAVRQHRFTLTDSQLDALVQYLRTAGGARP
jgi:mono/diheme cytochrome c family protein